MSEFISCVKCVCYFENVKLCNSLAFIMLPGAY